MAAPAVLAGPKSKSNEIEHFQRNTWSIVKNSKHTWKRHTFTITIIITSKKSNADVTFTLTANTNTNDSNTIDEIYSLKSIENYGNITARASRDALQEHAVLLQERKEAHTHNTHAHVISVLRVVSQREKENCESPDSASLKIGLERTKRLSSQKGSRHGRNRSSDLNQATLRSIRRHKRKSRTLRL